MTARKYRWTMLGLSSALAVVGGMMIALLPAVLGSDEHPPGSLDALAEGQVEGPLFELPDFELTNQFDEPKGLDDMRGRFWVADFIFTQCRGICPALSGQMTRLQGKLQGTEAWEDGRIDLVSISVDPENDTPEQLKAFAQHYQADMDRWHFLTGSREQIWSLVREGFRLPVQENPQDELMPIQHSERFVLVDTQGRVLDTYSVLEDGEMERLLADLESLLDN